MLRLDSTVELLFNNKGSKLVEKTTQHWSPVLQTTILGLICLVSFFIRLFAVIRYESVIHEFDPWFNYRTSQFLTEKGFYEFWNWFDDRSWYPLGRVVGQTLFPGLMTTSAVLYYVLNFLGICVNIRNICVFTGPLFSAFTSLAAFLLTREVSGRPEAGLFAALFMGTCPSYLSRSVAGSYDNEAVAIFALVFSFYTFIKAINTGRMLWTLVAAFAYFFMVASWGGYVFVTNTVAIYIFALLVLGKFTLKHYVVYSTYYVIGTVFCLNIPFVNFGAISSSEHMASHGLFLVTSVMALASGLKSYLAPTHQKKIVQGIVGAAVLGFLAIFGYLTVTGKTYWSGRSLTLLDPTYASKYIPIIASVSEHQPTSWSNYVMDLYLLPFLAPVGLYYCFSRVADSSTTQTAFPSGSSDGSLFLGVYGILAVYFSGVMIRLLLVLAPAACCLAGLGASVAVSSLVQYLKKDDQTCSSTPADSVASTPAGTGEMRSSVRSIQTETTFPSDSKFSSIQQPRLVSLVILIGLAALLIKYVTHATSMSSLAYSSPSIVMSGTRRDGSRVIQDDFREAYYWLRMNTPEDSKILSWWDYGYQITGMANRTVLVDNNTWNNTHIATVGLVLASSEEDAYPLLQKLDVDYVLVLYGGVSRYSGDDINKFLWPIRIASGVFPDKVQESDFIGSRGYTVDETATEKMKNSVMYKLCYYRAGELTRGNDLVRNQRIGVPDVNPKYFEEAFTSENWIVRIYRVKKPNNRGMAIP